MRNGYTERYKDGRKTKHPTHQTNKHSEQLPRAEDPRLPEKNKEL